MGVRVAVAGASGYAGGELLRLIAGHPDLELGPVTAGTNAGAAVTALHPHLAGLAGRTFEETDPDRLASADLVFLALHHEESAAIAARLPAEIAVIDLSASFRLSDPGNWVVLLPGPSTPAAGSTGCPSCPEPASRSRPPGGSRHRAATPPRPSWPLPLFWSAGRRSRPTSWSSRHPAPRGRAGPRRTHCWPPR